MLTLGLGTLVITLQDPIIKALMGGYPVMEAVAIRSLVALPIFVVLLRRIGGWRVAFDGGTRQAIVRALLFMVAYTTYFLAFPAMPLADVVALYFTAPLFVVLLSRPYLGEHQSLGRWLAVLVGFAGALVVAQPGTGGVGWAALLPISAAALYAFGQLMARRYGENTSATVLSFHQNWVYLVGALVFSFIAAPFAAAPGETGSLAFLTRAWEVPDAKDLILLALCGPIAVGGTILLTKAYREAPPGAVTPIEYMALIWDSLWGFLLFAEVPDTATIVGAALIIASGIFAVTRGSTVARGTA
ncbi:MAG: DMT family transporter [Gaiellales bacterium]